jgi:hypothetical protein
MSVLARMAQPDRWTGDRTASDRMNETADAGNQKLKPTVYQPSVRNARVPIAESIEQSGGRV